MPNPTRPVSFRAVLVQYPVVSLFLLLTILTSFWTALGQRIDHVFYLTFLIPTKSSGQLSFLPLPDMLKQQIWRIFTPALLHFGWVHIIFNGLWFYEFGRRVESRIGHVNVFCLIILLGVGANFGQWYVTPLHIFGGLSGIVYGLLGFILFFYLLQNDEKSDLPPGIFVFMLMWILVGYLGLLNWWARLGNSAHLSGFILGCLLGLIAGFYVRVKKLWIRI